jgi:hypothetical protein
MSYTREILSKRHRLSHQQIDRWLDENRSKEFLQEKIKHLKMVQNFIGITDLLRQNGIPFTCLKGPLLSQRIYNDPTVRYSKDIDILIDEQQIDTTVQFFLENGYDFQEGIVWPENKVKQKLLIEYTHHISFYNKELRFSIELHWKLMNLLPLSSKKIKVLVDKNQIETTFLGRNFTVLNTEFELLYLLLHGSRHGWRRLKWLVDVKDYPMEQLNIPTLNKLVKEFKAQRIIGQTNFLLNKFFDQQLPSDINQERHIKFNQIALTFIESRNELEFTNEELKRNHLNNYMMFPGLRHKSKILSKTLFRYNDIKVIHSSFKIVYYIYRPYSFIKRKVFHG